MNSGISLHRPGGANAALERYYRLHARFYDCTRWTFLFGRNELVRRATERGSPRVIHEIGCGTGHNLLRLRARCPQARITGWDLSEAMLRIARRRLVARGSGVQLIHATYPVLTPPDTAPELVVFSYALSMFNPGWEEALAAAVAGLAPGGLLAVVDFHTTCHPWFRNWMRQNHVRLEGHLLACLQRSVQPDWLKVRPAWGGLWEYFLFLGTRLDGESSPATDRQNLRGSAARTSGISPIQGLLERSSRPQVRRQVTDR
jgi:S-adenosylmethionine-diacylgycerolhomoserine-N-methlytransferase